MQSLKHILSTRRPRSRVKKAGDPGLKCPGCRSRLYKSMSRGHTSWSCPNPRCKVIRIYVEYKRGKGYPEIPEIKKLVRATVL